MLNLVVRQFVLMSNYDVLPLFQEAVYLRAVASLKLQLDRPEFILRKQEKEKKLKKIKKFFSQAQNCITALGILFSKTSFKTRSPVLQLNHHCLDLHFSFPK